MQESRDLAVLLERLSRVLQNDGHSEGLKPTQWEALRYLGRANRFSRTPSGLTAYLGMTKGTVSQTLNALERKGLLVKKPEPEDRRQLRLELTAKGRRLLAHDPIESLMAAAAGLPAGRRDSLAAGLEALLAATLAERDGRPFGLCRHCRFFRPDDSAGAPHFCGLLEVPLSAEDSGRICVEQEPA